MKIQGSSGNGQPVKPTKEDDGEDNFASDFTKALTATVAGTRTEKVLYYLVVMMAFGFFSYTAIDQCSNFVNQTITTIKVIQADSLPMPTVMVSIPNSNILGGMVFAESCTKDDGADCKATLENTKCPAKTWGNCADVSWKTRFYFNQHRDTDSCVQCYLSKNGKFDEGLIVPAKDKSIHASFLKSIHWESQAEANNEVTRTYTLNANSAVSSSRTDPIQFVNRWAFDLRKIKDANKENEKGHYIPNFWVAMLDPNADNFDNGQIWMGYVVNKYNILKITVEKTIDETTGTTTYAYSGSMNSVDNFMNMEKNQMSVENKVYTQVYWEFASYNIREITIRKKTFSELYAEIGGCWAGAALIIAIFFTEKVGGTNGKVQVFRFKGPSGRKALAKEAAKQLAMKLKDTVADEVGDIAGDVGVEAADMPAGLPATKASDFQDGQNEMMDAIACQLGPKAMKYAMQRLRPKLEPKLKREGLKWEDVLPVLELVDTPDELLAAIQDPDAFLQQLGSKGGALGIKLAIARLRPKLEPKLQKQGLKWEDMLPVLELIDTPEELLAAIEDPDTFLQKVGEKSVALGIKFAIAKLRPKLEPKLQKEGLKWEDVLPILDLVDTPEELLAGIDDPEGFLRELAKRSGALGIKFAIVRLRPKLEPKLQKQGLKWEDVLPVLELVDTPDELVAAIEDPDAFLKKLGEKSGALGIKFAIAKLRPKLEPKLQKQGLKWEDIRPVLELIDTPEELLAAIEDPESFLQKLGEKSGVVAIKFAIARLRPKLEPRLQKQGLKWEDVRPVLELVDTPEELLAAIGDPDAFLRNLGEKSGALGIKFAIAKLRPTLEPKLQKQGFKWVEAVAILETVATTKETLAEVVKDPDAFVSKRMMSSV